MEITQSEVQSLKVEEEEQKQEPKKKIRKIIIKKKKKAEDGIPTMDISSQ